MVKCIEESLSAGNDYRSAFAFREGIYGTAREKAAVRRVFTQEHSAALMITR